MSTYRRSPCSVFRVAATRRSQERVWPGGCRDAAAVFPHRQKGTCPVCQLCRRPIRLARMTHSRLRLLQALRGKPVPTAYWPSSFGLLLVQRRVASSCKFNITSAENSRLGSPARTYHCIAVYHRFKPHAVASCSHLPHRRPFDVASTIWHVMPNCAFTPRLWGIFAPSAHRHLMA